MVYLHPKFILLNTWRMTNRRTTRHLNLEIVSYQRAASKYIWAHLSSAYSDILLVWRSRLTCFIKVHIMCQSGLISCLECSQLDYLYGRARVYPRITFASDMGQWKGVKVISVLAWDIYKLGSCQPSEQMISTVFYLIWYISVGMAMGLVES